MAWTQCFSWNSSSLCSEKNPRKENSAKVKSYPPLKRQTKLREEKTTQKSTAKQITHPNVLSLQRLYPRCPGPVELPPSLLWYLYLFLLSEVKRKKIVKINKKNNVNMRACFTLPKYDAQKAIQARNKLNFSHNFLPFTAWGKKVLPQQRAQEIKPGKVFQNFWECSKWNDSLTWLKFLVVPTHSKVDFVEGWGKIQNDLFYLFLSCLSSETLCQLVVEAVS